MIPITSFAQTIQNGLNNNPYGIKFAVFTDASEYQDALITRTGKERYTNGIMRVGPSSVVPTRGVVVATQNVTLKLLVQLPTPETDAQIIAEHRAVLDGYFKQTSVQPYKSDGKTYTVSALYSLAQIGDVMVRPHVGTSVPFVIKIEYSYVENGLNSNDIVYLLDGKEIPYTTARTEKTPTIDSNVSSGSNGKSTARESAFIRGWTFEMPALDGVEVSDSVMNEIDGDDINTVHTLVKRRGNGDTAKTYTYSVVFAETSDLVQGILNAGLSFSLVERAPYATEE